MNKYQNPTKYMVTVDNIKTAATNISQGVLVFCVKARKSVRTETPLFKYCESDYNKIIKFRG